MRSSVAGDFPHNTQYFVMDESMTTLPFDLSALTPADWDTHPIRPTSQAWNELHNQTKHNQSFCEALWITTPSLDLALIWTMESDTPTHLTQGEQGALSAAIMEGLCRVAMDHHGRGIQWRVDAVLEGLRARTTMRAMDHDAHHQHIIEEVSAALPSWLNANPALRAELLGRVL